MTKLWPHDEIRRFDGVSSMFHNDTYNTSVHYTIYLRTSHRYINKWQDRCRGPNIAIVCSGLSKNSRTWPENKFGYSFVQTKHESRLLRFNLELPETLRSMHKPTFYLSPRGLHALATIDLMQLPASLQIVITSLHLKFEATQHEGEVLHGLEKHNLHKLGKYNQHTYIRIYSS